MSRALNDLHPKFRPMAIELIARCVEAGVPILIVNTLRTAEQQALYVANNVSWVKHSLHQDGLAIDLVPYQVYTIAPGGDKLEWNTAHPAWQTIGRIGEALGLRWGGRFKQLDMGHFEYVADDPADAIA